MYKITKNESLGRPNDMNYYCFPDITPANYNDPDCFSGREKGFQRISLGDDEGNDPNRPDGYGRHDETAPYSEDEKAERQAYLQGFAEGEQEGIALEKKQIDPVLDNFRQALLELEKIKKQIHLNAEKEVVELALAVAKKIVCHEISTNKDTVLHIVKQALNKVVDHDGIIIKLNPDDLQNIESEKNRLARVIQNIDDVTLEPDSRIRCGGCVIETRLGNIDARIEKQIEAVEEALKTELQLSI